MREAQITLPTTDVPRRVHADLQSAIVARFGGFTRTTGQGSWQDPAPGGRFYKDDVALYAVAMEPTPANDEALDDIAVAAGASARQVAVYVRHASGEVVILDVAEPDFSSPYTGLRCPTNLLHLDNLRGYHYIAPTHA